MAITEKNILKNWFLNGLKPPQEQFWAWMDSYWHKDEKIPITAIEEIEDILNSKAEAAVLDYHLTDANAHALLFEGKEDKSTKGEPNGYVPLDEFAKVASQFLNIVNDLVTGGTTSLLSAEQGKVLQSRIDAINVILTSDNVNLDTIQELVDAIETIQLSLNTILVNDLTTGGTAKALTAEMGKFLQTNKVDKVAGERLINAAEITKISGLSNITTTVKTILSTVLATQNVAGFVSYINALTPVLVVGANEIVKYTTSDTGRTFELNLRGRSFGVGQAAITVADIIEITEFLNKDIKFSNYPSTRNDGQLPTNKVLAPDVNGNLKLYTIATAPAPYLDELIPDSCLPSTTANVKLRGSFFTPTMTVAIAGQTVNYVTFRSDNEVDVNVTTGSAEGSFAVTLNNGISATFSNALLIVLGAVFKPTASDWINITNSPDITTESEIQTNSVSLTQSAVWSKTIDITKKFRVEWNFKYSPLLSSTNFNARLDSLVFVDNVTPTNNKGLVLDHQSATILGINGISNSSVLGYYGIPALNVNNDLWVFEWDLISLKLYQNGVLRNPAGGLSNPNFVNNQTLKFIVRYVDFINIKYIELAS